MRASIPRLNYWDSVLIATLLTLIAGLLFPLSLAITMPVCGLVFFIIYCFKFKSAPPLLTSLGLWLLALITLMGLSSLWSVNQDESFERFLKTAPLIITSYLFFSLIQNCPADYFKKFKPVFLITILITGILLCLEMNFMFVSKAENSFIAASNLNKNIALFALILPSCFYILHRYNLIYLSLFTLLTISLFYMTESQASQLAILVMAILTPCLLPFLRKITKYIVITLLITLALLMPFIAALLFDLVETQTIATSIIPPTGLMRLENWDFIAREIFKSPFIGYGMDATRYLIFTTDQLFFPMNTIMHPHNGFMQIWIETGLIGACLVAAGLGLYALKPIQVLQFVVFTGAMVILLLSWSIWSGWLIAGLFLVASISSLALKERTAP